MDPRLPPVPVATKGAVPVGEDLVLALHAEDLSVSKRQVVRTVQIRRETQSRDRLVEEALTNTGVVIEHVPVGMFVDAVPPVREEGDTTILPVVEEVVVIERRLRLVEEVRIRRVQTAGTHVETVKLREQHVVVTRSDPVTHAAASALPSDATTLSRRDFMSETIVAVFDTAAHAEMAVSDLLAANVPQSAIHRHTAEGSYSAAETSVSTRRTEETGGFWSSLFGGSSSDHEVYDRTLESGGNVVTVTTVPENDYEAVVTILEKHNPVDIDERASAYSSTTSSMTAGAATMGSGTGAMTSGLAGAADGTSTYAAGTTGTTGMMPADTMTTGTTATGATMSSGATMGSGVTGSSTTGSTYAGTTTAEAGGVIQLAEEELAVGKRLVNRGGTRVRRYVVETPFEQNVTLREEKVTLERRPVTDGRPVTDADFTDKTIELTETAEEAVVAKTARVVEEVSLGKTATERTETVRDTLRKEEVDIEQIPGTATTTTTTTGTLGTTTSGTKV